MQLNDWNRIDEWARRHHGLITHRVSGLSLDAWYRAIRGGRLVAVHPGVARVCGAPTSTEQAIAAAVLAVPWSIASHRSAALLHGLPTSPPSVVASVVDVSIPDRSAARRLSGVVVHRPADHHDLRPVARQGIACTPLLRTLVDLAAVEPDSIGQVVGHVLADRRATVDALSAAVERHARQGRAGVAALRAAIDAHLIDAKPADSLLESAMRRLQVRHGLPPTEFHPVIEGWEVDFRVIGTPVVLECDGWTSHGTDRRQFERDRRRDAELVAAGWVVLRFTYRQIVQQPSTVAHRIAAAVDRWAAQPVPNALAAS